MWLSSERPSVKSVSFWCIHLLPVNPSSGSRSPLGQRLDEDELDLILKAANLAGDGGDQQGDWVTHGDFRLDLSEDFLAPSTAHLTPQRQVRYAAVLHSGVAIRGIFQKGEILCETFSTRVTKDVPLGDWAGTLGYRPSLHSWPSSIARCGTE